MSRVPSYRLRRSGIRVLLTGALVAMIASLSSVSLLSQTSAHAVDEVAETAPQLATLVIAPEAPVLERDAENYRFTALLRNPSEQPLARGVVTVSIDTAPIATEAELTESAELAEPRESLELALQEIEPTPALSEQVIEITVPRSEMPLAVARPSGVYEVRAHFVSEEPLAPQTPNLEGLHEGEPLDEASQQITASTMLVWGSVEAAAPLPLTLVVPLMLPGSVLGVPTREELTAVVPSLLQLLGSAEQRSATLAVDPRIIAGTRGLGTAAPGVARELIDRLENTTSPVFMLQFADADPAAQASLGFDGLMQPTGLDYVTRLGTFAPPPADESGEGNTTTEDMAADGPTPGIEDGDTNSEAPPTDEAAEGQGDPGAENDEVAPTDGSPTLDELLTLTYARPGAWPAGGQVDNATLALLARSSLTSIVLSSTSVRDATGTRVTLGEFEALVSNAELEAAAAAALGGQSLPERNAGLSNLAARLALAAQQQSEGQVLALDRGALAETVDSTQFFEALDALGWAQFVPEHLQPEGTAQLRSGATEESRREMLRTTMLRSEQIDQLAPLLEQPEYLGQYQRVRLLEAFAARYAAPQVDFAEVNALTKLRDQELLNAVQPVTTENTQLVGTSSRVPVTLSNALPFDAIVSLRAVPTSAAITLTERNFEARVPAVGSSAVLVPVHSRVSSGESGLLLEVRDASGEQVFGSGVQHLTLRTTVETTIMVALGSAAVLLFGFGIWRSVRRKRKYSSPDPSLTE